MGSPPGKAQSKRLIGLKAIAEYLQRSERTVCRYVAQYELPVERVGGLLEADSAELEKWRQGEHKNSKQYDIQERLNKAMSGGMNRHLDNGKPGGRWEMFVPYNLKDLQQHLEFFFEPEMTWDNYGREWHIDHVRPLSLFLFTSPKSAQFQKAWALNNLMPRWATTKIARKHASSQIGNINKGNSILPRGR
jgi:hypothetical protein